MKGCQKTQIENSFKEWQREIELITSLYPEQAKISGDNVLGGNPIVVVRMDNPVTLERKIKQTDLPDQIFALAQALANQLTDLYNNNVVLNSIFALDIFVGPDNNIVITGLNEAFKTNETQPLTEPSVDAGNIFYASPEKISAANVRVELKGLLQDIGALTSSDKIVSKLENIRFAFEAAFEKTELESKDSYNTLINKLIPQIISELKTMGPAVTSQYNAKLQNMINQQAVKVFYDILGTQNDVFSLGLVFAELLTGQNPVSVKLDDVPLSELRKINLTQFTTNLIKSGDFDFSHMEAVLGFQVTNVLRKALSVDPADRYATPSGFPQCIK